MLSYPHAFSSYSDCRHTMQTSPSNLTRGYFVALLSAAILSTTAIFIRYLTQTYQIPALVLAFWRDVFVVITLLPALALMKLSLLKVDLHHLTYLVVYGFVLAVFNSLWTLSVALNGAAVATVLVYCSAAFTVLLGWWLLKERLDWSKILAVALSLAGCALVAGAFHPAAWQLNFLSFLTGILSGLAYAVYSLMGRSASQRGLNPWSTLIYTFGFASCFLLVINLLPGLKLPGAASQPIDLLWLGNSYVGWGVLFMLAAGPTVLGFGLYNVSLTMLPSGITNLIATTEPAFTAVIAYFVLGERLTGTQILGAVLILSGVILLRLYEGWMSGQIRSVPSAESA